MGIFFNAVITCQLSVPMENLCHALYIAMETGNSGIKCISLLVYLAGMQVHAWKWQFHFQAFSFLIIFFSLFINVYKQLVWYG